MVEDANGIAVARLSVCNATLQGKAGSVLMRGQAKAVLDLGVLQECF